MLYDRDLHTHAMPSSYRLKGLNLLTLALILLEVITDTNSTYTDIYNFPMLGVLMYETGGSKTAYGSVTLSHSKLAICAAENLLQLDPTGTEFITNSNRVENIYVYAGTDLLHPPSWYEKDKVARVKVAEIILSKNTEWVRAMTERSLKTLNQFVKTYKDIPAAAPDTIVGKDVEASLRRSGWVFNPFHELQWDVALLVFETPLTWTPYILPIHSFFWTESRHVANDYAISWSAIEEVEKTPHDFVPCSIPGWSPIGNNEIIYHRVVYIRFKECAEAICGAYPSTCLKYLNARHHICFKSLGFADSCVLDQGAPIWCSWYPNKIIGILTKTFECGTESLPSVVTRLNAITVFAAVSQVPANLAQKEPSLDDPRYTENPNI